MLFHTFSTETEPFNFILSLLIYGYIECLKWNTGQRIEFNEMKGHFYRRGCTCQKRNCFCGSKWAFVVDIGIDPVTGKRKQKSKSGFRTKRRRKYRLLLLSMNLSRELTSRNPVRPFVILRQNGYLFTAKQKM